MEKSLAMIEYATVASGMRAADLLSKTAEVRFLTAKTVCPGKYIVLFEGELSAIKAAVDRVRVMLGSKLIDCFVLGNPHPGVAAVIESAAPADDRIDTLGIIETRTSAAAVMAADIAVKASRVRLMDIRLAKHMCGKAYVLFTGTLAEVEESVAAVQKQTEEGVICDYAAIPAPDKSFTEALIRDLR